jgi:disulfide bond formation protein DsbB
MRAKKKPCKLCLRVRVFLILVGCVVAAKFLVPDLALPKGINYGAIVGDLVIVAFIAVFAWKWWEHRQNEKAQAEREKLEPWRAAIREIAESRRPR